ncbi:hypothetical protein BDQ12DRAFT_566043, partial [Crucibulum laeve]
MENLASTYKDQGGWTEAEKLEVEVMEKRQQLLGPTHPDTLMSMGNLAGTYQNLGKLAEAEVLLVQVARKRREILGFDHPYTATS